MPRRAALRRWLFAFICFGAQGALAAAFGEVTLSGSLRPGAVRRHVMAAGPAEFVELEIEPVADSKSIPNFSANSTARACITLEPAPAISSSSS